MPTSVRLLPVTRARIDAMAARWGGGMIDPRRALTAVIERCVDDVYAREFDGRDPDHGTA